MDKKTVLRNTLEFMEFMKYDIEKNKTKHHIKKNNKLTGSAIRLLHSLELNDGINQRAISKLIRVSPQAVCKVVKQLEEKNFVEKRPSTTKNETLIYITDLGRVESVYLTEILDNHAKKLYKSLTDSELIKLNEILVKLLNNGITEE